MIDSNSSVASSLSLGSASPSAAGSALSSGFGTALSAAQKAQALQEERNAELKSIKEKGFRTWVRDTSMEKLKEELRKRVMASMGLTDDDMSKMTGAMQQILEQKIKDEVEKRLAQTLSDGSGPDAQSQGQGQSQTASQRAQSATAVLAAQEARDETPAATSQPGKKDQDGIYCPVIPALVMSGGMPLF